MLRVGLYHTSLLGLHGLRAGRQVFVRRAEVSNSGARAISCLVPEGALRVSLLENMYVPQKDYM